jgi:hypothetical protein
MLRKPVEQRQSRRGVVLVLVAVGLISILGVVALAVDGGVLQLKYREARAHADAAAMAAACVLFEEYPKNQGTDPDKHAHDAAIAIAKQNGVKNDKTTSQIVVNIPPLTGPYKDRTSYVEVEVTYYQQRAFSRVFGSAPIPVKARAVARGAWVSAKVGVLILDYDDKASLNAQGNGAFTEVGAPVIVNSNSPSATVAAGNGTIKADEFYITGGLSLSGSGSLQTVPDPGKIYLGTHPSPDPLAYLPVPSMPPDGKMITESIGSGNKKYTLSPGRYVDLPTFNTGDIVILQQASTNTAGGIFYLDGGGFHSTGATVQMGSGTGGVMIYNKPHDSSASNKLQISGNPAGSVTLTGLTSGPYQGMVLWQERTSGEEMLIEGNGNFNIEGTLYAAGARLNINGNGKTSGGDVTGYYYDSTGAKVEGSTRIASQYISRNLSLGGNGNVNLNYTENSTARTRIITLVE